MIWKSLMKNPILAIGILLFSIFMMNLARQKNFWNSRVEGLRPTSCRAVLVKLDRRIPANWNTKCEGNNLAVLISVQDKEDWPYGKELQKFLYRTLANHMVHIARNSPTDNLERTDIIRIRLVHENLSINAVTEGKFIVKLATLKGSGFIAQHLKATVQIKESPKK
jgi:hypothetical protein